MSSETEQKKDDNSNVPAIASDNAASAPHAPSSAASVQSAAPAQTAPSVQTATPVQTAAPAQQAEPDVPLEGPIFRRKYFVPVSKKLRISCLLISMACLAGVLYLNITHTPRAAVGSAHIVQIKDPGNYLALFKGPIGDPYGWQADGQFRLSLKVTLEPMKPSPPDLPAVIEQFPFKNLAGINYFSVAEFEVTEPGDYMLSSVWTKVESVTTEGYIVLEQDPVEKFFARWVSGIIGGIAFLIAVGFPVSARMAAATDVPAEKK